MQSVRITIISLTKPYSADRLLHSVRNDALRIGFDFVSYFDIGYWKFNIGNFALKYVQYLFFDFFQIVFHLNNDTLKVTFIGF